MEVLTGFLSLLGLAAAGIVIYVLAVLSGRLGEVARMRPWYRLFYPGLLGVLLAMIGRLLVIAGLVDRYDHVSTLLIYYLPLVIGLGLSLFTVWYYWKWLIRE